MTSPGETKRQPYLLILIKHHVNGKSNLSYKNGGGRIVFFILCYKKYKMADILQELWYLIHGLYKLGVF